MALSRRGFLSLTAASAAALVMPLPQILIWEQSQIARLGPLVGIEAITHAVFTVFESRLPSASGILETRLIGEDGITDQFGVDCVFDSGKAVPAGDVKALGEALADYAKRNRVTQFAALPVNLPGAATSRVSNRAGVSIRGVMAYDMGLDRMMLRFHALGKAA